MPLGGPRIQQIVQEYDNPPESGEDEIAESGEEQGPAGSTFRGSSGPLTGVGAARHRPNHGSASADMMTINPSALENLPAYEAHEKNDEDSAPPLVRDAIMNDGLHESIEEDEAIDMSDSGMNYNNMHGSIEPINQPAMNYANPAWNFSAIPGNSRGDNIVSGTGSDIDEIASDIVQNNSSASEGSIRGRIDDFSNAIPDDEYVEQELVPDMDEDQQLGVLDLHKDLLETNPGNRFPQQKFAFKIPDEEYEEPATEIHVEEGEGLDSALKID